ncbi:thioredoxin family protein [bacterium]|nr:thioredoxin family protein [bacterium]
MKKWIVAIGMLAGLLTGCSNKHAPSAPSSPDLKVVNSDHPGERLEIESALAPGKITVCEFFSDQCPPCREMASALKKLAGLRPDLAIRKFNLDRPQHNGIDFESPLAVQFQIDTVPCFRIYDEHGKLTARGSEAKDQVRNWYTQAQAIQRGQTDPGTRDIMKNYEQH